MKRPRPLEWAVLVFLAFVLVRVGPGVFLEWKQLAGLRTVSVFFALGLVGLVVLWRDFSLAAWPVDPGPLQRLHRASFVIAALPLVLAAALAATTPSLRHELTHARFAQLLPVVATVFLRVVGLGLPTLLLWLSVGLEVKRKGSFELGPYVRGQGVELLSVLRDFAPLLFILSAYAWMDAVAGGKLGDGQDALMVAADRALFLGNDPLELLVPLINQPLSEWLAFSYSFYAVLFPLVIAAVFMSSGRLALRETAFTLGLSLLIAYVSYSLVPVKGPVLSRQFAVSLEVYLLASVKEAMMDANRITWDCFPSMHTCCSVLLGVSAFRHARRVFWWIAPMVVSMPFACVYLRYHYVVDVLAGLSLAIVMIVVTKRLGARAI